MYHLCPTADCHFSCYFTKMEKQCKNNILIHHQELYNRLVSFFKDATKPNCGNIPQYCSTTFSRKLQEGTRVMTETNGNNEQYGTIRNQTSNISITEIMKTVQRLNGFAFCYQNVRYSPLNIVKYCSILFMIKHKRVVWH